MKKLTKVPILKLKTFFRTFKKSLTDFSYYKDILSAKFSFSFKYLIALVFLVSLIFGMGLSAKILRLIPQTPGFIQNAKEYVVDNYPQDLILTLEDKKIVSNVKEPYFIDLPNLSSASAQGFNHFLAISTNKGKAEDFTGLDSIFLLTADSLVVSDGATGYKAIPLAQTLTKIPEKTVVSKNNVEELLTEVEPYFLKILPRVIIVAGISALILYPVLRTMTTLVWEMLILFPTTLVLFIFSKIAKRKIAFFKIYQMAMHGLTVPILLIFVLGTLSASVWVSLAAWIIFYAFMIKVILVQSRTV